MLFDNFLIQYNLRVLVNQTSIDVLELILLMRWHPCTSVCNLERLG